MIYITGGAGFIGSRIIHDLSRYHDVTSVDFIDTCNLHNDIKGINTLNPYDFIDKFEKIIENGDQVLHQGACSDTMNYDPNTMINLNFNYSKHLFDKCQSLKIPLIYASSAAVYGDGKKGFAEKEECENPLNLYARSNKLFDDYVRCFENNLESQVVGLRYFNVYGKGEGHKGRMSSTIHQFNQQMTRGEAIKVFEGSENFLRDFISVIDVINVVKYFLKNPGKSGIFNCGTGKSRSFMDVANGVMKLHKRKNIEIIDFPSSLKDKYQEFTQADLSSLRAAGFKDKFLSLEEGIEKIV